MTALTMERPNAESVLVDGKKNLASSNFAVLPGMCQPPTWREPDTSRASPVDVPHTSSANFAAHKKVQHLNGSSKGTKEGTNNGLFLPRDVLHDEAVTPRLIPNLLRDKWDKSRPRRNRRAPFHPRDFFLGTTLGQYCLLGLMVIILIFGGALTWMAIGGTPELPPDFGPSLWISWGLFFDPGTQTGFDPTLHSRRVLLFAIILSIFGYWMMLTNMAMIVEVTRAQLVRWEKEHWRVRMVDHILILGWTEKTIFFIKELLHEAQQRPGYQRQQQVVILAEIDAIQMRQSIDDFLPRTRCFGRKPPYQFSCREGCPHDPNDLDKVSVASAQDVIVLGQAGNSRDSDLEVARVVLALASLPQELSGRVLAEVRCADTSPALGTILLTHIEGIHARSTVNRMLCLMACKPVVGDLLSTFSSFASGEEMYCVRVPSLTGSTFSEACHSFSAALVIGIKPAEGQVILAPEDDRLIASTDQLVVIAQDEDSIDGMHSSVLRTKSGTPALGQLSGRCSCCRWPRRRRRIPEAGERTQMQVAIQRGSSRSSDIEVNRTSSIAASVKLIKKTMRRPKILTGMDWDNSSDLIRSTSEKVQPSVLNMGEQDRSGNTFVIIGWPDDLRELLQELDCYVRDGCQVHVLSDRSIEAQKELLACGRLMNIQVNHHSGSPISVHCLTELPLAEAHSILILSEMGADQDAFSSDSLTIACAAMICGICEGKYGPQRKLRLSGRIICEVLDARSDFMLQKNSELKSNVKFFKSNALETGLFAMATSEPTIFNILVLLLCPTHDIGKLVSVSVTRYLLEEEKASLCEHGEDRAAGFQTSYWELHNRVRQHAGELLIGWHRSVDAVTRLGADVDRDEYYSFAKKDRLLVIRNNTSVPRIVGRMTESAAQSTPKTPELAPEDLRPTDVAAEARGMEGTRSEVFLQRPVAAAEVEWPEAMISEADECSTSLR
mmetsp:Transcript_22038/g.41214  ORF Transcript_22038/g.41214 Transcript_22038/m.41214 type:complete len:950 (-) Transcript_22038:48-2897(-)